MLRKRIATGMAVLMIFGLIGGAAHAETTPVTATVAAAGGLRFLQALPAAVALLPASGSYQGNLVVGVEEVAAAGANWRVTAQLAGPFTSGSNSIPASNLSMATSTVVSVPSTGVGTIGNKESGTLDAVRKIYENDQLEANAYTAVYTSTSPLTLTVPNGTPLGAYSATVTITLSTFL